LVKLRLVSQKRGGYKRVSTKPKDLRAAGYVPERKTLWGKQRRVWVLSDEKPHRLTLGLQTVWAGEYSSYTFTKFYNHNPTDKEVDAAKAEAYEDIKHSTKFGKYSRGEWWFDDDFNISVAQVDKVGRDQVYEGSISKPERWGVSFARKMIKSGRWFKQATLDKWRWALGDD
jgi:hypothetical protein